MFSMFNIWSLYRQFYWVILNVIGFGESEIIMPHQTTNHLTDKKLEQWFAALEKSNMTLTQGQKIQLNNPTLATQFLSRFGIKSPIDVIAFLNSPEGDAVTAMIREELAEIEAMEDYEEFLAQEESKREHRLLGFLLLALMYEQDAEADLLNEMIAAQNARQQHIHDAAT